jgi:hypothetical protein
MVSGVLAHKEKNERLKPLFFMLDTFHARQSAGGHPSASTPLPMPHMLPAPPKSSETRAIMLLISRDSEHVQV